jgi:site-specific recombinase XerD
MTRTPINILIRSFIESLEAEKGYAKNTCRGYRKDLAEFESYLVDNGFLRNRHMTGGDVMGLKEVNGIHIRGYLGYLHKRNKKSTIARKLSAVRSFFKFLVKRGIIEANRSNTFRPIFPLMRCFGCLTPFRPITFWMSETGQFLKSFTPAASGCRNSSE